MGDDGVQQMSRDAGGRCGRLSWGWSGDVDVLGRGGCTLVGKIMSASDGGAPLMDNIRLDASRRATVMSLRLLAST